MTSVSTRKPHSGNAGYVCELKCKLGGHVVIYDRKSGFEIDADERWIVMHEPSSRFIEITSLAHARSVMKGVARSRTIEEACRHADILPLPEGQTMTEAVILDRRTRRAKPKAEKPTAPASEDRLGSDPLFERFEGRSKFGEPTVHLFKQWPEENSVCASVPRSITWNRYADLKPQTRFSVCVGCVKGASS